MSCKFPAMQSTVERQSTPGNIVLLFIAFWVVMPWGLDVWRGQPAIQATVEYSRDAVDGVIIKDTISVKYMNRGTRTNYMINNDNEIMCMNNWNSFWDVDRVRLWHLSAFMGCGEPEVPYRVCSIFSVRSQSGIERKFGENRDFCTDVIEPLKEEKT